MQSFAILPAAGRSRRMGRAKLLLPWADGTLLEAVLSVWRASRVDATILVVHPDDHEIARQGTAGGAHVVIAETPPEDMKASVRLGLRYAEQNWGAKPGDVWMLAPSDVPLASHGVIDALLAAHDPSDPRVIVPRCGGRRGHPALFPWSMVPEVRGLEPDQGIDELLRRHRVKELEVSQSSVLADVDTPEDYRRLRPKEGPGQG